MKSKSEMKQAEMPRPAVTGTIRVVARGPEVRQLDILELTHDDLGHALRHDVVGSRGASWAEGYASDDVGCLSPTSIPRAVDSLGASLLWVLRRERRWRELVARRRRP